MVQYPSGGTAYYTYNSDGLVTAATPPGRATQHFRYGAWALPDSTWGTGYQGVRYGISGGKVTWMRVGAGGGSSGSTTYYSYDSYGRMSSVTDPEGNRTKSYFTGTNGNRSLDSIPGNRLTTYGYDAYGRQKWVQTPDGVRDSVQYDVRNRVVASYDGTSAPPTRFSYDTARYFNRVCDGCEGRKRTNGIGATTMRLVGEQVAVIPTTSWTTTSTVVMAK